MATKPTLIPAWGTTGTKTEPSSGLKNAGFSGGTLIVAEYENWRVNLTAEWCDYLLDGDMEGAHSFDSLVTFNGATSAPNINSYGHGSSSIIVGAPGMKGGTTDNEEYMTTTSGDTILVPIFLPTGKVLVSYEVFHRISVATATSMNLFSMDDSGTVATVHTLAPSLTTTATWDSDASGTISSGSMATEKSYYVAISNISGNLDISMVKFNFTT